MDQTMKSTIEETLKKQDGEAYRDELTAQMVALLERCQNGEPHRWRLRQWEQRTDQRPLWSAYSSAPVMFEQGPTSTTAKLDCFCGASVEYKS